MQNRIKDNAPKEVTEPFKAQADFYGDVYYWRRANILMRLVLLVFLTLCVTQRILINCLLLVLSPLPMVHKLNVFIQL